jgi:general secretion pathway protein M
MLGHKKGEKMKGWWNTLSLRDKRVLCSGLFIITCMLLYECVWHPLIDKNQLLHQQIQDNKQLIVWMSTVNQEIQTLEKKPTNHFKGHSSLSIVQDELKKSKLIEQITELKQAENDSIQLHFQGIYFDKLMSWLIKIYQEQGFVIAQIEVSPTDGIGIVNGQMILQKI